MHSLCIHKLPNVLSQYNMNCCCFQEGIFLYACS